MNKTFYLHIIVVNHGVYVHCLLFQKFPERRVGHSDFLFFSILHGFECCCTDHSVCSTYHLRRPRYKTLFFFFWRVWEGGYFYQYFTRGNNTIIFQVLFIWLQYSLHLLCFGTLPPPPKKKSVPATIDSSVQKYAYVLTVQSAECTHFGAVSM